MSRKAAALGARELTSKKFMQVVLVLWMCLFQLVAAESRSPYLTPLSVVPAIPNERRPMQAGTLVTIYGRNLGPDASCSAGVNGRFEPRELCGTVVTVDGEPAGLLYVHEQQINLRLPARASSQYALQFIVTHGGRSSPAVPVLMTRRAEQAEQSVGLAHISLLGRAYVHMPIWIAVNLPGRHQTMVRYPISVDPADLGGHYFEVRRGGTALPRIKPAAVAPTNAGGPMSLGTIGGGRLVGLPHEPRINGRLPLHVLFRFDDPGQYQVRFTGFDANGKALVRSGWLALNVEPYSEQRRRAWLQELQRTAPSDSAALLSEYLPSLLAKPDFRVLTMVEPLFYHADEIVRRQMLYALYRFEDHDIVRWVPDVLKRRGPTPDLAYLLSWRRKLFEPQSDQIFRAVAAHLRSQSLLVVAGSLQALSFMKLDGHARNKSTNGAGSDAIVLELAESIANHSSLEVLQALAMYLGTVKTDGSRRVLWRMVEERKVPQQALICLSLIGDLRDLPRLASYLHQYDLKDNLRRAYGNAAAPYLKQ